MCFLTFLWNWRQTRNRVDAEQLFFMFLFYLIIWEGLCETWTLKISNIPGRCSLTRSHTMRLYVIHKKSLKKKTKYWGRTKAISPTSHQRACDDGAMILSTIEWVFPSSVSLLLQVTCVNCHQEHVRTAQLRQTQNQHSNEISQETGMHVGRLRSQRSTLGSCHVLDGPSHPRGSTSRGQIFIRIHLTSSISLPP